MQFTNVTRLDSANNVAVVACMMPYVERTGIVPLKISLDNVALADYPR